MKYLTVWTKLLWRKFLPIDSFCKECGRTVQDFHAPQEIWDEVERAIRYGYVLCYDCFCKKCRKMGLPSIYSLIPMNKQTTNLNEKEDK